MFSGPFFETKNPRAIFYKDQLHQFKLYFPKVNVSVFSYMKKYKFESKLMIKAIKINYLDIWKDMVIMLLITIPLKNLLKNALRNHYR